GQFVEIGFAVPVDILEALRGDYADLQFALALNVPQGVQPEFRSREPTPSGRFDPNRSTERVGSGRRRDLDSRADCPLTPTHEFGCSGRQLSSRRGARRSWNRPWARSSRAGMQMSSRRTQEARQGLTSGQQASTHLRRRLKARTLMRKAASLASNLPVGTLPIAKCSFSSRMVPSIAARAS